MDTWISWIFGYMDTWIHGYPFSLDTWIFGYFGYQFFSLSRFWISYPSIRIFLDTFLNHRMWKKTIKIQVLRKNFQSGALFVRLTSLKMISDILYIRFLDKIMFLCPFQKTVTEALIKKLNCYLLSSL